MNVEVAEFSKETIDKMINKLVGHSKYSDVMVVSGYHDGYHSGTTIVVTIATDTNTSIIFRAQL